MRLKLKSFEIEIDSGLLALIVFYIFVGVILLSI